MFNFEYVNKIILLCENLSYDLSISRRFNVDIQRG